MSHVTAPTASQNIKTATGGAVLRVYTCGVRLLSTNQQLSRELPSLHVEPDEKQQAEKVSESPAPLNTIPPFPFDFSNVLNDESLLLEPSLTGFQIKNE